MAIVVSTENLRNTATTFKTQSTNIENKVNEIDQKIKGISIENTSRVLTELYAKFAAFKTASLPRYCEVINQYAQHLETVAETYETTEDTLVSNQSNINNDKAFK